MARRQRCFWILFSVFLLLGIFIRVWRFGTVPGGINQDEAFAGYEAWALLNFGLDSSGHSFPVYLTAWGSGMNALASYLMMPFIAVFGLEVWVIRLPQLIASCLTLVAVFGIVRRLAGGRAALIALLLVAVCPWHVYLSRWGLESNLAPGFLTFGLYFFVRGLETPRFLPLAALMYGLSLYAYAVLWPILPILLMLMLGYGFYCRKLRPSPWLAASAVILLALAAPLVLFLLVNYGLIPEFTIGPFSVPKLVMMRSSEISLSNITANAKNLWELFAQMVGRAPFDYDGSRGLFSICTLPFFLFGLYRCIAVLVRALRRREVKLEALLVFHLLAALLLGLLTAVNETRFNCAYIPMLLVAAVGLDRLVGLTKKEWLTGLVFAAYLVHFGVFADWYFIKHPGTEARAWSCGLEEALEAAGESEGDIVLDSSIYWSNVLFYTQLPVDEFLETVEHKNYPSTFLDAASFGRYSFGIDLRELDTEAVYIFPNGSTAAGALAELGFGLQTCGCFTVASR